VSHVVWWFFHLSGIDNPSGYWYSFWSGLGGTGVLGVIAAVFWQLHKRLTQHHHQATLEHHRLTHQWLQQMHGFQRAMNAKLDQDVPKDVPKEVPSERR
jgi:hypothetical protein